MRQRQAICLKSLCWQCKSSRAPAGTRASWDRWIVVASFPFTYTLGLSSDQVSNLHIVITIIVTIQRVVGSCSRLQSWHSTYCSSGIIVLHTYNIYIYKYTSTISLWADVPQTTKRDDFWKTTRKFLSERTPNDKTKSFLKKAWERHQKWLVSP